MALRAPPLWLSDQKAKARTCVLVNCAAFLAVWYAGLGGWALALALMVCFGLMLFGNLLVIWVTLSSFPLKPPDSSSGPR